MNICIIYSTPTDRLSDSHYVITDEDTKDSAEIVKRSLERLHHNATLFPVTPDNISDLAQIKADLIFNLIEWCGSDLGSAKKVFSVLDRIKIPYTGCKWKGYLWSSEKMLMKKAFNQLKIPTPKSFNVPSGTSLRALRIPKTMQYPFFVKLAHDHCSVGLTRSSLVHSKDELIQKIIAIRKEFNQDILIEEFISGRELHVPLLVVNQKPVLLPATEIVFSEPTKLNFLTFESRWDEHHPDFNLSYLDVPEDIPQSVQDDIERYAFAIMKKFAICDYARFDLRLMNNIPYFLEVNANPGLDENEDYEMTVSSEAYGFHFDELINAIVSSASARFNIRKA